MYKEAAAETARATPALAWLGTQVQGITLDNIASLFAITLLGLQIGYFVWDKIIKPRRAKRRGR